jgi:hypothetical protein
MLKSESYLERGDAPAQAVLRANAEQQAVRKAIATQEELHKIRERVCIVSDNKFVLYLRVILGLLAILFFVGSEGNACVATRTA